MSSNSRSHIHVVPCSPYNKDSILRGRLGHRTPDSHQFFATFHRKYVERTGSAGLEASSTFSSMLSSSSSCSSLLETSWGDLLVCRTYMYGALKGVLRIWLIEIGNFVFSDQDSTSLRLSFMLDTSAVCNSSSLFSFWLQWFPSSSSSDSGSAQTRFELHVTC